MDIKRNESLIVPIQVHALCVGEVESKQKGSFFSPPTASFISTMPSKKDGRKVPFISGPSIFKPFETDSGIEKGVHLHWFLPDALTHASVEPDEEGILQSVFPVVPNRWLVTRVCSMTDSQKGPQCSSKSWVVESDFLSTDIKYRKSANIPYADSDIPYRYMGRAVPLEQWNGDESNLRKTKQERYQGLTAIGYGDPCFSIYYPNCKNVFGFHDDLDDLLDTATEICNLSYSIIGWFSKSSDDPFSGLDSKSDSTVELEKCLKNFNWTVQSGSDLLNINKTICCGLLKDVKWKPKGEFITRKMDVSVGIGNTVSDGLSALLASEIQDGGEKTERLLETLQAGCLDQLDKVDAMADLTRRLHKNSFAVESAGILWSLQPKDPDQDIGYQDLDSNTALKLDELNRKQSQFNSEFYELDSRKSQTFLDWYKYMLFKYDQDTEEYLNEKNIDSEKFKSFIEQNTTDNTRLNELQLEIEQLRQSLIHDIGDDFLLKDIAAPRYFKPNDPVVLLAGEDLQPTLAYSPNDILPCLLESQLLAPDTFKKEIQLSTNDLPLPESSHLPECAGRLLAELFFLDTAHMLLLTAMSSLDNDQANLDTLRKKIEEKQKSLSAFYLVENSSLSPATIAINTWSRPWNPLFMHWRIEYQPLEIIKNGQNEGDMPKSFPSDLVTSRFRLSEHTIDLSEKISSKENYEPYTGISILTPHAIRNFDELARAFSEQIDDLPQISSARRMLSKVPVLSQSLGGFHEALIMRQEEMQFPIDDPLAEGDEKSFHERIKKFVAQTNQHSPLPLNFFNPIRAGRMKIDTIRVVDTFGQYRNTSPRKLCIAKNLTPKENDGTHILLPPRLAQPSRLLVRWISAQKGLTETSEHPASTPICGWIVPNFLDQSLVIYDSEGRPVGVIRSRQRSETVFRNYPGITPEFYVTFQNQGGFDTSMEKFVPKNIFLRNFVTEMLKHDANHLMEFIKTLDRGLSFVEPEDAKDQDIKALLTGRPIALARLSVKLDIKGLPAANQSWSSLAYDIFNQSQGRDCADFTDIRFPILLGTPQEKNEYNDGLIGYYKAGKDNLNYDCNTFYSWHADGSNEDIKKQSDSTLEITAQKKSPSLSLLVLMDPRAKLFVTSGILPKKGIEIPRFHFDNFWSSMGASFLTSPVLRHLDEGIDGINIPVSNETDYKWMWVSKEGDSWFERPVINGMAAHGSPIISEGWLKLVKK